MHALILGARAPACLEWCRAFRAAGWRVTAADSLSFPVTRASGAIDAYVRVPEPRRDYAAWIASLRRIVVSTGVDLVLPTCEEVFYLAAGRDALPCRVVAMPLPLLAAIHDKYRFARMTTGWPSGAPESHLLSSKEDLSRFESESESWVFKPVFSRFASHALLRPRAARLERIVPHPQRPWVAQRFVSGREHCSFSVFGDGRLAAHACYHPRYRVGQGSGIWFEPTDPAPVRAFVERFGAETGFSGQVGFDFIEAPDGRVHVLECNPRATSGVHLFDDQPEALVSALLGDRTTEALVPTPTPRMVGFAMLLFSGPARIATGAFWRDFRAARDVVTRRGDRLTLPAQLPGLAEIAVRALVRRRGLLAAATSDIEWDGQPLRAMP